MSRVKNITMGARLGRAALRPASDGRIAELALAPPHAAGVPAAPSIFTTCPPGIHPTMAHGGGRRAGTSRGARRSLVRVGATASSAAVRQDPEPVEPGALRAIVNLAVTALALVFLAEAMAGSAGPFAAISMAAPGRTEAMLATARSAWAGLAAGCLHTLAGPDHLAALAPLTIGRSRAASAALGALWGGGHSTGQLLIGLLFILFKDQVQGLVPVLSRCGTTLVGITLILIGIVGIQESKELAKEDAAGEVAEMDGLEDGKGGYGLATYATGIIYGLQPDALFVIIPALALPTKAAAAAFVLTFVFGTVAAMSSYTAFIGTVCQKLGERIPSVTERLAVGAAAIAIALGIGFLLVAAGVPVPFLS